MTSREKHSSLFAQKCQSKRRKDLQDGTKSFFGGLKNELAWRPDAEAIHLINGAHFQWVSSYLRQSVL